MKKRPYEVVVLRFIDFLEDEGLINDDLDYKIKDLEDLFRVSLCKGLGLSALSETIEYEKYIDACKDCVLADMNVSLFNEKERQSFLQSSLQVFHKVVLVGEYL